MTQNPNVRPTVDGAERQKRAKDRRDAATALSADRVLQPTPANGEEQAHDFIPVANFSKGLLHDTFGLPTADHYKELVEALSQIKPDGNGVGTFDVTSAYSESLKPTAPAGGPKKRQWESPLAGLYYSIEGPDPAALGIAPAPRLGYSELCAEIAEVYAFAIVRDIPFATLENPNTALTYVDANGATQPFTFPTTHVRSGGVPTMKDLNEAMGAFVFLNPNGAPLSSVPGNGRTLTEHETARRTARFDSGGNYTLGSMFRGSAPDAKKGPHLSQFMLLGTETRVPAPDGTSAELLGDIQFGAQSISQKIEANTPGVDYMTTWDEWLAIQNADDTRGQDSFIDGPRRFITTPRDLATYVHFDELYQAYFNACLIMLKNGVPFSPGFPNSNKQSARGAFATFGGPHVLSLLTEVASRGLKAVRRQKFQVHRRARPEVLAARLAQVANQHVGEMPVVAQASIQSMLAEFEYGQPVRENTPGLLLHWIAELNTSKTKGVEWLKDKPQETNYLLPMAFPEGSPMHAAYGAGHATVAGACVTILKAFFDMSFDLSKALNTNQFYEADTSDPTCLRGNGVALTGQTLTGELNKLAANISIGRNMAGVHYYSDYFDSLRLGERIAAGIIEEQMLNYNERVSMEFQSFDGDDITIETDGGPSANAISWSFKQGSTTRDEWFSRHTREYLPAQQPANANE